MKNQHRKNKKKFFGRPVWQNSTKSMKVTPQRYYLPDTLKDLMEMVQEAIDTKTPIRAVGSGHSFSQAPKADGILLDTDNLKGLEKYAMTNAQGHYFEVLGGVKVRNLNRELDKLGFCITTMGGIDHQSVAGAISTGTHGSSMQYGSMSKMVRSIVMVTHDQNDKNKAKTYRIEPSQGFTIENGYAGPELIKDDTIFNAALLCFGSMGIIYSYVLEVEKMYFLTEKKEVSDWPTVKALLKDGSILQEHRSVFIQINPYIHKKKQIALIAYHDLHQEAKHNLLMERIKKNLWYRIKRTTRSFQFALASFFPYFLVIVIWRINKFPGYVPKFLNNAVKAQKDEAYFNKGYRVMYQGLDYIKERACDCEIAITMDENGDYLDVLEDLMKYLQYLYEEYKIYITSPVGLRFVKSSNAFLSPEYKVNACYIDTPVLMNVYGRDTIIFRIQQFLVGQGARPHWGKLNDHLDLEYVKNNYVEFNNFMNTMVKFNPDRLFSNIFTKRILGI